MAYARHDMQTNSGENCELDLDGSIHQCRIDTISSSGASINCLGFLGESWPGDRCVVRDQSGEHPCHIAQIAAANIRLRFDRR